MKQHIDYLLSKQLGLLVTAVSLLNFGEVSWAGYFLNRDWIISWKDFGAMLAASIMLSFICVTPTLLFMRNKSKILKALSIPILSELLFTTSIAFWYAAYAILGVDAVSLYDLLFHPEPGLGIGMELIARLFFSIKLAVPFIVLWLARNRNTAIKIIAAFLSVVFVHGVFLMMSDSVDSIDLLQYFFILIFNCEIESVNFAPAGIGVCTIFIALFVIAPVVLELRRHPRLEAEPKTNIAIAAISVLLLCSLALNGFFYCNGKAAEYKKTLCPMQMESIRKLEAECQDADREVNAELPEDAQWLGVPDEARQDWGALQIDMSVDYKPLITNNKVYRKGIGTHASATLVYNLDGKYERLTAILGLDEGVSCSNGVQVKVFGDEKLLADSGELGYGMDFSLDVSLKGIEKLVFDIDPMGDKDCDHVNIAVPILHRAASDRNRIQGRIEHYEKGFDYRCADCLPGNGVYGRRNYFYIFG
jgi:hypothetical protein